MRTEINSLSVKNKMLDSGYGHFVFQVYNHIYIIRSLS